MKWIKWLGFITVFGILAAIGRIVVRVFREESRESGDRHSGV